MGIGQSPWVLSYPIGFFRRSKTTDFTLDLFNDPDLLFEGVDISVALKQFDEVVEVVTGFVDDFVFDDSSSAGTIGDKRFDLAFGVDVKIVGVSIGDFGVSQRALRGRYSGFGGPERARVDWSG